MIEQALFTSAETDRVRGYQLIASSSGVGPQIARELTTWGPSHESLCDTGGAASSVNFHPLGGDRWCVAQSVAAGEEYSGRGGTRVYTQSFVVGTEELGRFANNPFSLLRAVRGRGLLKVQNSVPSQLTPFELPGRSAAVDEGVLADFTERYGAQRIAWLVEAALTSDRLLVLGAENRDLVAAGLMNCLPAECRPELSFATGLVYSPRRPFKINLLNLNPVDARRLSRQSGVTVLNLADEPPSDFVPAGWAAYLFEALAIDGLPLVCAELERTRSGLRMSDLAWLAEQLTERLHFAGSDDHQSQPTSPCDFAQANGERLHAHPAHERLAGNAQILYPESDDSSAVILTKRPSAELAAPSPEALEMLEHLDDLVFDTINGRRPALDELTALWPRLSAALPASLLAESREQYLRYAIKLWDSCAGDDQRDASWAVAALDVLCILFSGA
jgi:GTPase-associated protein 1, N-terminal domain type 2